MRKIYSLLLFLALTISACSIAPTSVPTPTVVVAPTAPPQGNLPQTEAGVPRVTLEEARAALESGAAVIVDVRSAESFAEGHIAGALSIPLANIEANPAGVPLDKNQWIITYCT
jgi:3-mercaptopyruvate sulfurtransferase SseA